MQKPTIPKNARLSFKSGMFEVYEWEQELYDGSKTIFSRIKRQNTVKAIPILSNRHILQLAEEQPSWHPYVSFPGGRIEEDEDPQIAGARELLEETGYRAKTWTLWLQYYPFPTIVWELFLFIAQDLEKVAEPTPDPGEKITLQELTFNQFLDLPQNPDTFEYRAGGLFNEELIRAQYDKKKRAELERLLFGSSY